jgi:hypothetical protein
VNVSSKIVFGQGRVFENPMEQASLERLVAVNRHGKNFNAAWFGVDVMTAANTPPRPTTAFKHTAQLLPGDLLHNSIS